jgi:hypothetical protein
VGPFTVSLSSPPGTDTISIAGLTYVTGIPGPGQFTSNFATGNGQTLTFNVAQAGDTFTVVYQPTSTVNAYTSSSAPELTYTITNPYVFTLPYGPANIPAVTGPLITQIATIPTVLTVGATLAAFNAFGSTGITLTGSAPNILNVNEVGMSPSAGPTTLTNAIVTSEHDDDATAIAAASEASTLDAELTTLSLGGDGITVIAVGPATLPSILNPVLGNVNVYTFAAGCTNTSSTITINGSADTVVVIKVANALTLTDVNVILSGGQLSGNVYWQIGEAITITNDDATSRTIPGTFISQTSVAPGAITVTDSGAGNLSVGRLISLLGGVTLTQSGAGVLSTPRPPAPSAGSYTVTLSNLPVEIPTVVSGTKSFTYTAGNPVLPYQFTVNFSTGVLTFNAANSGASITVTYLNKVFTYVNIENAIGLPSYPNAVITPLIAGQFTVDFNGDIYPAGTLIFAAADSGETVDINYVANVAIIVSPGEIISAPPVTFTSTEAGFGVFIILNNPGEFTLDLSAIRFLLRQVLPATTPFILEVV